jgi:hypothetical protein
LPPAVESSGNITLPPNGVPRLLFVKFGIVNTADAPSLSWRIQSRVDALFLLRYVQSFYGK